MQLGKLDVSQSQPELSCKTPDLPLQSAQWVTGQKQNSLRRLRAVNKIVAHLNERWRVIECAAGIQWILQHRAGERHGTARWDDRSYCRTREALIRCCRASAGNEFHDLANIFPMLAGDEAKALAHDIFEHDLREPITFLEDQHHLGIAAPSALRSERLRANLELLPNPFLEPLLGPIEREDKAAAGTIKIILRPVNQRGRSKAL